MIAHDYATEFPDFTAGLHDSPVASLEELEGYNKYLDGIRSPGSKPS